MLKFTEDICRKIEYEAKKSCRNNRRQLEVDASIAATVHGESCLDLRQTDTGAYLEDEPFVIILTCISVFQKKISPPVVEIFPNYTNWTVNDSVRSS